MKVGFVRTVEGDIYACATIQEENFAAYAAELKVAAGDNETAIDLFMETPPKKEAGAIAAVEALIDIDSGGGTFCNAIEWFAGRIYAMGIARGRSEALADLDAVVERLHAKLTF